MNILPLILTFITVFALCSSLFMSEKESTFVEEKNYTSYMVHERDLRNTIEKKEYLKALSTTKSIKTNNNSNPTKRNIPFESRREINHPLEISRLNISLLFENANSPGYDVVYEGAAKLIRQLYSHTKFFTMTSESNLEYQILDSVILEAKTKKEISSFKEFCPPKVELQTPFYKMLKGTSHYDIKKKEGYPPLEDYLCIDEKTKEKPLAFCFASAPVLEAILGEKLCDEVLAAEEKKWQKDHKSHTVTKTELNTLLMSTDNPFKLKPQEILSLASFSKNRPPSKETTITDPQTKIFIKKRLQTP